MKISVSGMGYVGAVSGSCLSDWGYRVIGAGPNPGKVIPADLGSMPMVGTIRPVGANWHHFGRQIPRLERWMPANSAQSSYSCEAKDICQTGAGDITPVRGALNWHRSCKVIHPRSKREIRKRPMDGCEETCW